MTSPLRRARRVIAGVALAALSLAAGAQAPLPGTLAETGLSGADLRAWAPQYPLWSDGAAKQRWMRLPPGTAIDASDPDAWRFPNGTRLWKQFSLGGRPVETRYIERLPDGRWRFATYAWNAAGTQATLVPEEGGRIEVPGHGTYVLPSRYDCVACHDTGDTPVLGVSALQLSPDRDPLAPHAEAARDHHDDLDTLQRDGLLVNWPGGTPRIAASHAEERAVLGYLHGNCGHCHAGGASAAAVPVDLVLQWRGAEPDAARASLLHGRPRMAGATDYLALVPHRMRSRDAFTRMPPLGNGMADEQALALIERWTDQLLETTR